jgi:hypothetical protein
MFVVAAIALPIVLASSSNPPPYGNPYNNGCNSNELNLSITSVPGLFCSPPCSVVYENGCNPDRIQGITAMPECMIGVNSTTNNYCALICNVDAPEDQCDVHGGASCHHVSGVQGVCTYKDDAKHLDNKAEDAHRDVLTLFNPSQPAIDHALVAAINANPMSTWIAKPSLRFQGWTLGRASNIANGALQENWSHRTVLEYTTPGINIPTDFDPRLDPRMARCNATIAHVRDQTDCGGCCKSVFVFIFILFSFL